jgi:hypothetical protein
MLTSWDRDVMRHLLRLAFMSLLRRITGEPDLHLRERLAFAGNAVRDAARWLVQGADPAMILFSLSEVSIEDLSPEADAHIEAIRLTCRNAITIDKRRLNAFRLLILEHETARNAAVFEDSSDGSGSEQPSQAGEVLTKRLG